MQYSGKAVVNSLVMHSWLFNKERKAEGTFGSGADLILLYYPKCCPGSYWQLLNQTRPIPEEAESGEIGKRAERGCGEINGQWYDGIEKCGYTKRLRHEVSASPS